MASTRLTLVYTTLVLLAIASLVLLYAYTQHRDTSVYHFLFPRTDFISNGTAVFTLSDLEMTNTSIFLYGFVADVSRGVSKDVVLHLGYDVIKEIIRPSVPVKKYFSYVDRKVREVNCEALIQGNRSELLKANRLQRIEHPPRNIIRNTQHCLSFKLRHGYITEPLSKEEEEFPVAFSILVISDPAQGEQLLRAIYRPQNVYCIYVDANATNVVTESMTSLEKCFDNVFISSRSVSVEEKLIVLESDIICMEDLLKHKQWKYYINLFEQDFPLKTNLELVSILTSLNGTNAVSRSAENVSSGLWTDTGSHPYNITPVHGSSHVMVTRQFVDYALHNQTAKDLLAWVTKTMAPDEIYFATLNYNPQLGVPGAFTESTRKDEPFQTCFQNMRDSDTGNWTCTGKFEDDTCVFGVGDLSILTCQPHAFASKVNLNYQRYTLLCLEEWHYNNTRDEYIGGTDSDDYYK